jgi:hypothetical protein
MRCQFLEQRQLRLVVIEPPAEAAQPKDAERQRQRQRVSRVLGDMRVDQRQCLGRGAFDRARDRVDVLLLSGRDAAAQLLCPSHCRPRLGHSGLKLQQAGTRDVGERKIGIGRESALQQFCGPGIRRQQEVDRRYIVADCCGGGRSDGKIEAVRHFHNPHLRLYLSPPQ